MCTKILSKVLRDFELEKKVEDLKNLGFCVEDDGCVVPDLNALSKIKLEEQHAAEARRKGAEAAASKKERKDGGTNHDANESYV